MVLTSDKFLSNFLTTNLNKMTPTDQQIIDALLSGKTVKQVCKTLGTHSQRVDAVTKAAGLKAVIVRGNMEGCKSRWVQTGEVKEVVRKGRKVEEFGIFF